MHAVGGYFLQRQSCCYTPQALYGMSTDRYLCGCAHTQAVKDRVAERSTQEAPLAAPRGPRSPDVEKPDLAVEKDQRGVGQIMLAPAVLPDGVHLPPANPAPSDPVLLAAQLKQVQELQAEVERLRAFTAQHLVNSEKVGLGLGEAGRGRCLCMAGLGISLSTRHACPPCTSG